MEFNRFPCPVCNYLRENHTSSCPECHWREPRAVIRAKRFQFDLATLFDFVILVAMGSAVIRIFLGLVSKTGLYPALWITILFGFFLCPFIALYRWWASDNF